MWKMNIDKFTFKQKQSLYATDSNLIIVMEIAITQHRSYYIHEK